MAYDTSCVIGLKRGEEIVLNPGFDEIIRPKDEVIVITEDDDTIKLDGMTKAGSITSSSKIISNKINQDELELSQLRYSSEANDNLENW